VWVDFGDSEEKLKEELNKDLAERYIRNGGVSSQKLDSEARWAAHNK